MHEFELLPTEEQMRDMVREFHQVEMRRDIMAGAMCSPHEKERQKAKKDINTCCDIDIHKDERCNIKSSDKAMNSHGSKVGYGDSIKGEQCQMDITKGEQCYLNNHQEDRKSWNGDSVNVERCHRDINSVDNYPKEDTCDHRHAKACTKAVVAKIQKAYYLQCDIEQALKRLHSVAPPIYRQEIGELIKTKRDNTQQLLTVYSQLIGDVVSYAPTLYNGRNFCKTLLDICTMQEKLLNCLIGTEECTGALWLVSREIVVATTLTRMSIFCLFNR